MSRLEFACVSYQYRGTFNANDAFPMKNDDVKSTVEMDPMIMAYGLTV